MKIKTTVTETEIECNAEELRQSNTVAEGLLNVMRRAFNGPLFYTHTESEEEEGDHE